MRSRKPGTRWTEEMDDKIRKLAAERLNASLIAARIGADVTRNMVIGRASRLGVKLLGRGEALSRHNSEASGVRAANRKPRKSRQPGKVPGIGKHSWQDDHRHAPKVAPKLPDGEKPHVPRVKIHQPESHAPVTLAGGYVWFNGEFIERPWE